VGKVTLPGVPSIYDEVPYTNLPFTQTRPSALATVAALHGLSFADPREARVLELGCGAGANLCGIAAASPGVSALGVDLAPTAIATASAIAAAASLENVRFEVADVKALGDGRLGQFDYVIVHGLYAWGDASLRAATLAACKAHLAPDGLAYVSYNAHPGGYIRRMLRDMAQYHARGLSDPRERAERARLLFALLHRLGEAGGPTFYDGVLGEDVHALAVGPTEMLVHDLLSADYEPVWLVDFVTAARSAGLEYVADAIPEASRVPQWTDAVEEFVTAASEGDRVAREQYFDVLVVRRFRHSMLCHGGRSVVGGIDVGAVPRLLVEAAGEGDGSEPSALLAAAIRALDPARGPVPFGALLSSLHGASEADLAEALVEGFHADRVAFHAVPPPGVLEPGPHPRASPLVRSQARPGALLTALTNHVVRINDEPTARLLSLLDGTRDREAIRREFEAADLGPLSSEALADALSHFARAMLLVE
jgi:SAM-dependent methyltransferase